MDQPPSKKLERLFREPGLPNLLKPGMVATACCNIRTALSALGYRREWKNAERYDDELKEIVEQFQAKNGHRNVDGRLARYFFRRAR